ncbi:MAG: AAA family ATPase [Gemmatimonadetes bacterium]|nr:AAA family ATPase [Gemmatimonadota bacterium]
MANIMNIDRVRVRGLFRRFDHDLAFPSGESVMIVIGPNGFGKTTTLRLIDLLFSQSIRRLATFPFQEIAVVFDEGTILSATRTTEQTRRKKQSHLPLTLSLQRGSKRKKFNPPTIDDTERLGIPFSAVEDFIPHLDRVGHHHWFSKDMGEMLDFDDVLAYYGDFLPTRFQHIPSPNPDWLQDILQSVAVRFIDTERLTGRPAQHRRKRRDIRHARTVRRYSDDLGRSITESIAKYGTLSQSLDRTFPTRLVAGGGRAEGSVDTLRQNLDSIERKRAELEEVGLLEEDPHSIAIPDLLQVDEPQRDVLAVYVQDAKEKLEVFDDLYEKVSTFKRIANSRFHHKQVAVSKKGVTVTTADGTPVDLEKLSSGEQHQLVMLYELLFRATGNSLLLIDEPELSLHVAWQAQFVKDLEETAKLSNFRAILATHSPEIIGDRWDLTVALNGSIDN